MAFRCGYNSFEKSLALATSPQLNESEWASSSSSPASKPSIKLLIYDCPHSDLPYEERMNFLRQLIPKEHPYIQFVESIQCGINSDNKSDNNSSSSNSSNSGKMELWNRLKEIERKGGEGVILRKAKSYYYQPKSIYSFEVRSRYFHYDS